MRGRLHWVRWQPTNRAVWTPWHYSPGVQTACGLWAPSQVGAIETQVGDPPTDLCPVCGRRRAWLSRLEAGGATVTP